MFTREGERRRRAGGVGLGEVLSPSCSFGKSAPRTGARAVGFRLRGDFEFGPDRLARTESWGGAPAVGEGVDEEETTAGLVVRSGFLEAWPQITVGVGHLDAQGVRDNVEGEPEVASADTAVGGRVRREFGDDLAGRVQGDSPRAELFGGEQTTKACPTGRGREPHAEVPYAAVGSGLGGGGFVDHVTQSGKPHLP